MNHLFNKVYYMRMITGYTLFGHPWIFYHTCGGKEALYNDCSIQFTGKCATCKKFILSYKTLEVMAALKELTK